MRYFFLVWAGLWRRRTRTILTLLSAIVAFFLFGMLQGVDSSLKQLVGVAHLDRLYVMNSALLPLPLAYLSQIEKIPGVTLVTQVNAALGSWQNPRNQLAIFVVDPNRYFAMLPEFSASAESQAQMRRDRRAIIVAAPLMRKYGWKTGQQIVLDIPAMPRQDGSVDWPVVIAGSATYSTGPDSPIALVNFDYFDAARLKNKGTTQRFLARIADPAQAAEISDAIDAVFANSPVETRTETEKAFAQGSMAQIGDVGFMVDAVMGAVFFTLLLLVGNSLMQSFRERIREFGILKTIGFPDRGIAALVISEALLLCGLAGLIGLSLAQIVLPILGRASGGLLSVQLSLPVIGAGLVAVLFVSLVSAWMPAWKASHLSIVESVVAH